MQKSPRANITEGTNILELCRNHNPDIRLFLILSFARLVALLGYALRTFSPFHRDEIYATNILGVRLMTVAAVLLGGYALWMYFSTGAPLARLLGSRQEVCDIVFNAQPLLSRKWLAEKKPCVPVTTPFSKIGTLCT